MSAITQDYWCGMYPTIQTTFDLLHVVFKNEGIKRYCLFNLWHESAIVRRDRGSTNIHMRRLCLQYQ